MSASNAPGNPSQPKRPPPNPAAPTTLRRLGPSFVAGGIILAAAYTYFYARPAPAPNPLRTPGVKNIEASFRGAGATGTHTPAYGGTKQGSRDDETFRGDAGEGASDKRDGSELTKSAGKREFNVSGPNKEKGEGPKQAGGSRDIGEAQRPASGQATGPGKLWNEMHYGNKDQK